MIYALSRGLVSCDSEASYGQKGHCKLLAGVRMSVKSWFFALTALSLAGPVLAGTCTLPRIDGGIQSGQADRIDSDRNALLSYEACLAEQEELEAAFNSPAAGRTALQREAAANLRRTLDAWQRTRRAADSTPVEKKRS